MQTDPNQAEYWNRVAWEKEFSHPLDRKRLESRVPHLARVLDVGCGYGRTLAELDELGYGYCVGVDSASEMLARARSRCPELDLRESQGDELPFEDDSFDLVLLFSVLTCVPEGSKQRALMREVRRVLVPGGMLYISDIWLQKDQRNLERYEQGRALHDTYGIFELPEGVVFRHHSREWIEDITEGLERLDLVSLEVETMNGNRADAFQYFGREPEADELESF